MVKEKTTCKINFSSRKALSDKLKCFKAIVPMLCFKVKKKIENSSDFWKLFFERITKSGVIRMVGMKKIVQKNWGIQKIEICKIQVRL